MPSPSLVLLRTQSDARLAALAREGHERAFEAIVERYRRPLLRSCRRVLPEARAEDALQHALLAAWHALRRGDEVRELRPWLHRIAHNTSLNLLRQSGYDYDDLQESLRIADAADDELERRAVVRQTLHGLASLPPRQREALLAIAVEGRSQDEVAVDLGLSTGAVRQLVHRARTALRAAATAVVPLPLVSWVASAGAGGAGAAATLAKAGTVAVIAGGAVAGPALIEKRTAGPKAPASAAAETRGDRAPSPAAPRASAPRPITAAAAAGAPQPAAARRVPAQSRPAAVVTPRPDGRHGRGGGDGGERHDRSGHSGPSEPDREEPEAVEEDRSGPSHGADEPDRSGPSGGGVETATEDRSGPSPRSGSSGAGSGDPEPELAAPAPTPDVDSSGSSGSGSGHDDNGSG